MIAQVEKDFFEYTKKLEEGTIEQVRLIGSNCVAHPACRWLLSRAAARASLWEPLSSTQSSTTRLSIGCSSSLRRAAPSTCRLQTIGEQPLLAVAAVERCCLMLRPQLELEEGEAASVPHADPETIKKAEEVVKMLTQQIQTLETNTAAAIEQQEEEETVVVDPLSACVLPVRPARHSQLLITTRSQAPEFEMSESEDSVTLRISLPAVRKVGQIDAEVVERSRLELRVPELYSLDYTFSKPVDDDQMSCRFEKTTKTLVIKMPLLVS